MALIIGDFVVVTEGSAASELCTSLNQVIQVTSGNQTHLQSLVTAGLAKTIISPAKRYVALITQSATAAPTATVLRTTLSGAVAWARSSEGIYTATLASEFTQNKTFALIKIAPFASGNEADAGIVWTSANVLTLTVRDIGGSVVDGFTGVVEIEVYS